MSTGNPHCDRCDGLCCRVYDIIDSLTGKHVKKAGDKCGYLDISNHCRIHATRDQHIGFRGTCAQYDCMDAGPIVTIFARRIPSDQPHRHAIISSLLETLRIRIESSPLLREEILQYAAGLLNQTPIDQRLILSVRIVRMRIVQWKPHHDILGGEK